MNDSTNAVAEHDRQMTDLMKHLTAVMQLPLDDLLEYARTRQQFAQMMGSEREKAATRPLPSCVEAAIAMRDHVQIACTLKV